MRQQRTNLALFNYYVTKKDRARKRLERAMLKVIRASNYLARVRTEIQYCDRQMLDASEAMKRGEEYPKPRPKKKKGGRHIELD